MSEIITKTQPVLHRSPIENINYTGEVDHASDAPEKNRRWIKRTMLATVGYLAFVSVDNAAFYYDTARLNADDGHMLYDIDGCEPFPDPIHNPVKTVGDNKVDLTPAEIEEIEAVEFEFIESKSAATNFKPEKFNAVDFIKDWVEIHRHEQLTFTSEISGLDVHLYTDVEENPFDLTDKAETISVMDELIHISLDERIEYSHAGIAAYVDCLQYKYLDPEGPRELEEESLHIYVPSKPGVCFSNGLVQDLPADVAYKPFCNSVGATKDVRITAWPFYEYRRDWMVLMASRSEKHNAEYKISKMFIHEPTHFLMETAGMPFRYHENERLALYLENEVIKQLYPDGLPASLKYTED